MTVRRVLWMLARPFAWLGHRVGLWSLAPVNVAVLAWRRDLGDALDHFEHFGTPIDALPEFVILCGIGYCTAVSEGTVVFTEYFTGRRIVFERDHHDPLAFMWYVESSGRVAASHMDAAYRWIRAVFGGSFERRRAAA